MNLKIQKLKAQATLPTYGSADAAGADLYACIQTPLTIAPGQTHLVPTGIAMAIPKGYVGLIFARSGLACKRDLAPANKVGVIDSDYRGEIMVALHNHGREERTVSPPLSYPSIQRPSASTVPRTTDTSGKVPPPVIAAVIRAT